MHCSATPENRDYTPEMLLRDHLARGFNSYGYHFYIRKSGQRVVLRPLELAGAKDTRTQQQKDAIVALLRELVIIYPDAEICGHRDLSPDKDGDGVVEPHEWIKMCPCFDAKKEYRMI